MSCDRLVAVEEERGFGRDADRNVGDGGGGGDDGGEHGIFVERACAYFMNGN